MNITPEIEERLRLLDEKYVASGQDLLSYLDGLIYEDYLKYWNYIELETLLSLQKPRTYFPDEEIFILYHQITELYFKLTLNELKRLSSVDNLQPDFFYVRLKRMVRYFDALVSSFEVMVEGMDREEFMKFRMALLPASGFQSVQYRKIELHTTKLNHLVCQEKRSSLENETNIEKLYDSIYWKQGAIDLETGNKTLTLLQFEERYDDELIAYSKKVKHTNLWALFNSLTIDENQKAKIVEELKKFDLNVNVNWPLAHYKSAVRYLHKKSGEDVAATGGTNWQKYLPPRFQKRIFFPELWSVEERENWGKVWVEENLN